MSESVSNNSDWLAASLSSIPLSELESGWSYKIIQNKVNLETREHKYTESIYKFIGILKITGEVLYIFIDDAYFTKIFPKSSHIQAWVINLPNTTFVSTLGAIEFDLLKSAILIEEGHKRGIAHGSAFIEAAKNTLDKLRESGLWWTPHKPLFPSVFKPTVGSGYQYTIGYSSNTTPYPQVDFIQP